MSLVSIIEQVRQLPWATLDDMHAALDDAYIYGTLRAELHNVDGDLRLVYAPRDDRRQARPGTGRRRRDP